MKKIGILIMASAAMLSCQKEAKEELTHLFTRDSIQYFDVYNSITDTVPASSFSFDNEGHNERYFFNSKDNQRYIQPYQEQPDEHGRTNTWKVVNDSTIMILGSFPTIIERYTEDSIFIRSKNEVRNVLVRLKGDPNINAESQYKKDSIHEDYLLKQEQINGAKPPKPGK